MAEHCSAAKGCTNSMNHFVSVFFVHGRKAIIFKLGRHVFVFHGFIRVYIPSLDFSLLLHGPMKRVLTFAAKKIQQKRKIPWLKLDPGPTKNRLACCHDHCSVLC
jgi:hypothetical protein